MTNGTVTAVVLVNDALQKLGKVRLQLDLAKDLMTSTEHALTHAGDKVASAAIELRELVRTLEVPDGRLQG
jgi:N-acetylglucosamine-6-phosphate deacetylase